MKKSTILSGVSVTRSFAFPGEKHATAVGTFYNQVAVAPQCVVPCVVPNG